MVYYTHTIMTTSLEDLKNKKKKEDRVEFSTVLEKELRREVS